MKRTVIVSIVCLLILFFFSIPTAAERRGKEVLVLTLDAREITGELIAVKSDSLLLLEKSSGRDFTVKVSDIHSVKLIRRAKPLKGLLIGSLAGMVIGFTLGELFPGDAEHESFYYFAGAALGIPCGAAAGLTTSCLVAIDSNYLFKGRPPQVKEDLLNKLRKHARIKNQ